jgi:hypothetical protein
MFTVVMADAEIQGEYQFENSDNLLVTRRASAIPGRILIEQQIEEAVMESKSAIWETSLGLSGHPKPANDGHLKTGQRE